MTHSSSNEDYQFKTEVESCRFPVDDFNHKAHLRLAYVYLVDNDPESSVVLMRDTLKLYLAHNGVDPNYYHETVTKEWILAVSYFMSVSRKTDSANELLTEFPELLDKNTILIHYSEDVLFSDEARNKFLQPNLEPIPLVAR